MKEVIYPDGSMTTVTQGHTAHDGYLAIERIRLITAVSAISMYLRTGMEMTYGGSKAAIDNVIAPLTGKTYKRSKKGKMEALADAEELLAQIEANVIVYETEE